MRWCFDSGQHAYADHILGELEAERLIACVPVLWRYEVSAVLARAEIKRVLAAQEAAEFMEDLEALNIRVDEESANHVLTGVYRLAVQYKLTSYDAAYLELALRKTLPLATLDQALRVACASAGATVL
jgi:predicted nucleic acid-binding protein